MFSSGWCHCRQVQSAWEEIEENKVINVWFWSIQYQNMGSRYSVYLFTSYCSCLVLLFSFAPRPRFDFQLEPFDFFGLLNGNHRDGNLHEEKTTDNTINKRNWVYENTGSKRGINHNWRTILFTWRIYFLTVLWLRNSATLLCVFEFQASCSIFSSRTCCSGAQKFGNPSAFFFCPSNGQQQPGQPEQ